MGDALETRSMQNHVLRYFRRILARVYSHLPVLGSWSMRLNVIRMSRMKNRSMIPV